MEEKPLLLAGLDDDQANIQTSTDLLKQYAIYDLFEQGVPNLFTELLPALQENTPAGYFPFIRKTSGGLEVPTFDFVRFEGICLKSLDISGELSRVQVSLIYQNRNLSLATSSCLATPRSFATRLARRRFCLRMTL